MCVFILSFFYDDIITVSDICVMAVVQVAGGDGAAG